MRGFGTAVLACALGVVGWMAMPAAARPAALPAAQQCAPCPTVATEDLNLRAGASPDAAVILVIPAGTAVERAGSWEANGYAPVTYEGYQGWAAVDYLAPIGDAADATTDPTAVAPVEAAQAVPTGGERRVALVDLALRDGAAGEAALLATIPVGATMTLTREGDENGYVTVDDAGTRGWVYADLIGPVG
jgi:uncharacterized protein YraI